MVFGKVFYNYWEIVGGVVVGYMMDNMVERNLMMKVIFGLLIWKKESEINKWK